MLIKIELPVTSNIEIKHPHASIEYNGNTFKLFTNEKKIVVFVAIEKTLDASDIDYVNEYRKVKDLRFQDLQQFPIHPIERKMIEELLFLENVLSINSDINFEWDKIKCKTYAENNKETLLMKAGDISGGWGKIIHIKGKTIVDDIDAIINWLKCFEGLQLELNFYRHAQLAIVEENYIGAYFNLYHILESYYSDGQWRNQEIVFKRKAALLDIINELLADNKFKKLFDNNKTSSDIIDILVKTRHDLFHLLDINNPDSNIHYGNQAEYKNITMALSRIIWRAMIGRTRQLHPDL